MLAHLCSSADATKQHLPVASKSAVVIICNAYCGERRQGDSHLCEGVLLLCNGDLGCRSHRSSPPAGTWPGQLQQLMMWLPMQQLLAPCCTVAVLLLTADPALDGWCGCRPVNSQHPARATAQQRLSIHNHIRQHCEFVWTDQIMHAI